MTKSKVDLFLRGFFRGLSEDPVECHYCFEYYDSMYYFVSAIEQVYAEWSEKGLGIDGSYRIFLQITKVYEFFEDFEEGCAQRQIIESLWTKTLDG